MDREDREESKREATKVSGEEEETDAAGEH